MNGIISDDSLVSIEADIQVRPILQTSCDLFGIETLLQSAKRHLKSFSDLLLSPCNAWQHNVYGTYKFTAPLLPIDMAQLLKNVKL